MKETDHMALSADILIDMDLDGKGLERFRTLREVHEQVLVEVGDSTKAQPLPERFIQDKQIFKITPKELRGTKNKYRGTAL